MAQTKQNIQYYEAVGRRKEAVARVRLYLCTKKDESVTIQGKKYEKGDVIINGKKLDAVYTRPVDIKRILSPFIITDTRERFVTTVQLIGGGTMSQLGAITHGIARALVLIDEDEYKSVLRQEGYITRDARVRERRKAGKGGKARKQKQSPKR